MANFVENPCYSPRLSAALGYAADIHSRQVRKQGNVPYLCHLLQVCGLVLEAGGSEDEAIAALLHDAIEDLGIEDSTIHSVWGADVCAIVCRVSENKNLPPAARKSAYVDQLIDAKDESSTLVSCADKLHNLRSYATDGISLWSEKTESFYRLLMPIYENCNRIPRHWIEEMQQLLGKMERVTAGQQGYMIQDTFVGRYED